MKHYLWDKGYALDNMVEQFTVGQDYMLDEALIVYDCYGSIAHAYMLYTISILTADEFEQLKIALLAIIEGAAQGTFVIKQSDEDVHTAVENYLVERLGDIGKKIHTARSRNDQILLDIRLYMRDQTLELMREVLDLCKVLEDFARDNGMVPVPGRTHFQKAMPSSFGLWAGSFLESLLDDALLLKQAYELINQCPLGSGASYGVSLPIDRQLSSDLLAFSKVQNNVLYANNSRGKFEAVVLNAASHIMLDLSKMATDGIIFSAPEFNYVILPSELCPGSSMMPQKKNPDILELIRAKSAIMTNLLHQTFDIIRSLPSGYNRDFQETKFPLMEGLKIARTTTGVATLFFQKLRVNEKACIEAYTPELFATDKALSLVKEGMPFRDAYRYVAEHLDELTLENPAENISQKRHMGAPGNLGLEKSVAVRDSLRTWQQEQVKTIASHMKKLILL